MAAVVVVVHIFGLGILAAGKEGESPLGALILSCPPSSWDLPRKKHLEAVWDFEVLKAKSGGIRSRPFSPKKVFIQKGGF